MKEMRRETEGIEGEKKRRQDDKKHKQIRKGNTKKKRRKRPASTQTEGRMSESLRQIDNEKIRLKLRFFQ